MLKTRTDWQTTFIELQAEVTEVKCRTIQDAEELKDNLNDSIEHLDYFIEKLKLKK